MQRLSDAGTAKFADAAQSGGYNHGHASQMGHMSALRMQAARALQGRPTSTIPHPAGGPSGTPGGAVPGGGAPPVNYKAQIAGMASHHGAAVGIHHIHGAIDSMAAKGKISGFQANALKQHNGPLIGPQGQGTQTAIMNEMLGRH